jgi:hypothetical protein
VFGLATLLQGCGQHDAERIRNFTEQYSNTVEMQERAVAASYPYQLAETPETEAISRVFAKIRTRSASRTDLEEALRAERERRWYIDHFASETEAFRAAVTELRNRASAIGEGQIREAAAVVCQQFAATLESIASLLGAQRVRSGHVTEFLETLITRERRFPPRAELEEIGGQLQQLRRSILRTMKEHEAAFQRFQTLAGRDSELHDPVP